MIVDPLPLGRSPTADHHELAEQEIAATVARMTRGLRAMDATIAGLEGLVRAHRLRSALPLQRIDGPPSEAMARYLSLFGEGRR